MKKALVSFAVGPHVEFLDIARPSFKAFADRHGYDYFEPSKIDPVRPAPWYKIKALLSLLKGGYDVVVFLGADTVIVDGRDDILQGLHFDDILTMGDKIEDGSYSPGAWQAMVRHATGDGDVPNDDVWICTKLMIPWLEKVWTNTKWMHHGWWEQAALLDLMGYQVEQPTHLIAPTELYDNTAWLDRSWNVHIWDRIKTPHPRIQHATMWPDRPAIMRVWAKEAEGWING
jgi:hypothetical protein